jgi:hypothetical protein
MSNSSDITMSYLGVASCGGSRQTAKEDWDTSTVRTGSSSLGYGGAVIDRGAQREVSTKCVSVVQVAMAPAKCVAMLCQTSYK